MKLNLGLIDQAFHVTNISSDGKLDRIRLRCFKSRFGLSGNLVYRARLEPNGVGLTALRADPEVEFVASADIWFRPVQMANGPDGALYVLDMYRYLIEATEFMP